MKDKFKFIVAAVAVSLSMSGLALASIVVGPGFQEPGYTAVYELAIPAPANFSSGGGGVPYALNIPGSIPNGSFPRITPTGRRPAPMDFHLDGCFRDAGQ